MISDTDYDLDPTECSPRPISAKSTMRCPEAQFHGFDGFDGFDSGRSVLQVVEHRMRISLWNWSFRATSISGLQLQESCRSIDDKLSVSQSGRIA